MQNVWATAHRRIPVILQLSASNHEPTRLCQPATEISWPASLAMP